MQVLQHLKANNIRVLPDFIYRLSRHQIGRSNGLPQAIVRLLYMLQRSCEVTFGQLRVNADFERVPNIFSLFLVDQPFLKGFGVPLFCRVILQTLVMHFFDEILWGTFKPVYSVLEK